MDDKHDVVQIDDKPEGGARDSSRPAGPVQRRRPKPGLVPRRRGGPGRHQTTPLRAARHANRRRPQRARTAGAEQALAALLLLREVREQLAGWETGLIETARARGRQLGRPRRHPSASPAARPPNAATCAAAARHPPEPPANSASRPPATRRAADRTVTDWARDNAADLRRLAGQITALTDLPTAARHPLDQLHAALAHNDAADLIHPLNATRPHLTTTHPDLAARLDTLTGPAAPPTPD